MTKPNFNRRAFFTAALGGAAVASAYAQAPAQQQQVSPVPAPRDWLRQDPVQYPDPDIVALDNRLDRKSTRLNSSHSQISYAVFCLKKNKRLATPPGVC